MNQYIIKVRFAFECPGVPGGSMDWQCPAAWSETLNTTVCAQVALKEVAIILITPTKV